MNVDDNVFPKIILSEAAAPASPSAGQFKLYVDSSDHLLKYKNSAGTVVTLGQGIADTGTISTYVDLADQGSDPSSPSAGKHRLYAKAGGLYDKDSSGTVVGAFGAGGGGGAALSTLGYNTAGGSFEVATTNRWYCKSVSSSGNGVLLSIGAYIKAGTSNGQIALNVAVFEDNSGAPGKVIAYNHNITNNELLTEATLGSTLPRWVEMPIGAPTTAATFWIAANLAAGGGGEIAYDTGTDQYFTTGGGWVADPGGGLYALTVSSRKYSIRATFLV